MAQTTTRSSDRNGSGLLINASEFVPVEYDLRITQEYLILGLQYVPHQRNIRGRITPVPSWATFGVEYTLQLSDGQPVKCWLNDHAGEVVCEGRTDYR